MRTLQVDLGDRSYPIFIGDNLLSAGLLNDYVRGSQVLIVTNETVAPLYLDSLKSKLETDADVLVLPDGERFKNMEQLNGIFDCLLKNRHNRTTTLIALGGGVIGDITGFAAACYQRGVAFIQVPTTLLAQVDSSVGGKTAVNHPGGKNMIGAFHQPLAVFADVATLSTLPDREYRAGMAEVIKYGLIIDAPFFDWLESNQRGLLERDSALLEEAIEKSCANKARVVSLDEREAGIRAILNLGHTFGHAIETFTHYEGWLHGEAVATGMLMAADLSLREGTLTADNLARISALIGSFQLPTLPPVEMNARDFIDLMAVDKKVVDGQLKLVLLNEIGEATITSGFSQSNLMETLDAFTSR
ncbi:MAG: 3-dehydroquinate synthase [bacterium]